MPRYKAKRTCSRSLTAILVSEERYPRKDEDHHVYLQFNPFTFMHIRIFSPSLTHRIADPMPLPRRNAARRVRLHVRALTSSKSSGSKGMTWRPKVKRVPLGK